MKKKTTNKQNKNKQIEELKIEREKKAPDKTIDWRGKWIEKKSTLDKQ